MATSEEVLRAARRIEHHTRTRSGSSLRSRTSSATSLRSVWEPSSPPAQVDLGEDSDEDDDNEYEDEDADAAHDGAFWMKSRRPSAQKPSMHEVPTVNDPVPVLSLLHRLLTKISFLKKRSTGNTHWQFKQQPTP